MYGVRRTGGNVSTHSRAEAAALLNFMPSLRNFWFQHTAARRQLRKYGADGINLAVSTHSRAEAAARLAPNVDKVLMVSTHSRAEAAASRV